MSMCYWICQGVGIRANQLRPFLNPQKCIQLLKEQLPSEEISEDGFDIDDYLYLEIIVETAITKAVHELIERLRYDDIQAIDEEEFAAAVRKLIFDADPGVQLPF